MPDETEPTPATPAPEGERPPPETESDATPRGVQVPKWLAVSVIVAALAGGGFAVGRATAADHHGGFAPIGDNRPGGGPGGRGGRGGFGGGGTGGNGNDSRSDNGNGNSNEYGGGSGSSNAPTPPSTTPGTTGTTGT